MQRHKGRWEETAADAEPFRRVCGDDGSRVLYDTGGSCLYECWGELKDALWDELHSAINAGTTLRQTETHALLGGSIEVARYDDPKDGVRRFAVIENMDPGGDYRVVDYPDENTAVRRYVEIVRANEDPELPYRDTDLDGVDFEAPIEGRPEMPEGLSALPDGSVIASVDADEWRYVYGRPRSEWALTPDGPAPSGPVRAATGKARDWAPARVDVRDVTPPAWPAAAGGPGPNALALAVLHDGRTVLASAHDDAARLWNLRDGAAARTFSGHTEWVLDVALAVTGDGTAVLATAGKDRLVRVWSAQDGAALQEIGDHRGAVNAVAWACPPGQVPSVVSGSDDGTVRVWSAEYARERACFTVGPPGVEIVWSVAAAVLPDGHTCVAAASDGPVRPAVHVWDVDTGAKTHEFPLESRAMSATPKVALATLEDGSFRVAAASGSAVHVWDGLTGELLRTFPVDPAGSTDVALGVLPDLRVVAAATSGPLTLAWEVESGAELVRLDHGASGLYQPVELVARPGEGLVLAAARQNDHPARALLLNLHW
ncbi:WD40 repeat domain-containing protein [Actinomadura geliboluensis]|uniref:WD40 repeat domain-containing protein n=1 Tax=Actinomadura geliboluensis TaxID=882440 RepID=UPI00371B5AD7